MEPAEILAVLKKVEDIAMLAGIRGRVNEERMHFECGFNLPENRSQMVFVRIAGKTMTGGTVVSIFSPCHIVSTGFLKGLSKQSALDLLKRNEQVMFARFGVWSLEGNDMVVASADRLVDAMDHTDFHSLVWYVAIAADGFEKSQGSDKF
jgi:hypothetical protein